jgi:hypothetical protein
MYFLNLHSDTVVIFPETVNKVLNNYGVHFATKLQILSAAGRKIFPGVGSIGKFLETHLLQIS